jgi:cytochrome c oxidase assembly protein subunit 15
VAKMTTESSLITKRHRDLLMLAAVLTFLVVTLGGIVCLTDASGGCPDWPWCHGQLVPPLRIDSILEYTHRVLAGLASLSIFAAVIAGWRKARSIRWVTWPPTIAVAFLLAVVTFGAMVVLRGLEPGLAALDLGSALVVLALVLSATVVAFRRYQDPDLPDRLSFGAAYARLTLGTLVVVFVVLVSGVLVAPSGSAVRCLSWPLYGTPLARVDFRGWLGLARLALSVVASVMVIAVVLEAWRGQPGPGGIRTTTKLLGLLFAIELVVGAFILAYGYSVVLQLIHVTTAAALWACLVVLVVLAGLASPDTTSSKRGVYQ